jgi:hypothetical protein
MTLRTGPSGPFAWKIDHYSDEWDNAPMPYSIFFTDTGDAFTAPTSSAI